MGMGGRMAGIPPVSTFLQHNRRGKLKRAKKAHFYSNLGSPSQYVAKNRNNDSSGAWLHSCLVSVYSQRVTGSTGTWPRPWGRGGFRAHMVCHSTG